MHHLTIYKRYFTASDCYKVGINQTPKGVQVHSTGANNPWLKRYVGPDDGRLGVNKNGNYSNKPGSDVCASAYIGKLADGTIAVYQSLPWNYRCWLSGKSTNGNANQLGYIGFEICEDGLQDEQYFNDAMQTAMLLTAHLCELIGAMPDEKGPCGMNVMDHRELHAAGYASNHADIRHWLHKHGKTMDDFRARVREIMLEGIEVEYVDTQEMQRPTLRMGSRGTDVEKLQTLLREHGYLIAPDGVFGYATKSAVEAIQQEHRLMVDGVCGPMTWAALTEQQAEQPQAPAPDDPAIEQARLRAICEIMETELREEAQRLETMADRLIELCKEVQTR